jgi:hypothetical protein
MVHPTQHKDMTESSIQSYPGADWENLMDQWIVRRMIFRKTVVVLRPVFFATSQSVPSEVYHGSGRAEEQCQIGIRHFTQQGQFLFVSKSEVLAA